MLSIVLLFAAFVGSADAFNAAPRLSRAAPMPRLVDSTVVIRAAVLQKADAAFECGVCGGMGDWCPACRGPTATIETKEVEIQAFECGVCGGMGDWCPVCRGPAAIIDLNEKAEPDTNAALECGVCGGMGDWCPACRGPAP